MTGRAARWAVLTALAMALSWLESMVPVGAPGMKLGLANLAVVFALYRLGAADAAGVSLIRVLLVSLTFGNAYSFLYSLAGAAVSLAVMVPLKRWGPLSVLGVSIAGGVGHNAGQLLVAMAVLETGRLVWYLPGLLAAGLAAGACIGIVGGILIERVKM